MDLDLGPEIAEFRSELRDWITASAPDGLAGLTDWTIAATTGGYRGAELARAAAQPEYAEWERRLADARLICPQWPQEFGGQGMDGVRLAVLNEEFHQAGLPRVRRGMGETLVGPSIIVHGTARAAGVLPAQDHLRRGRLLPGILRAEPGVRPGRRADQGRRPGR